MTAPRTKLFIGNIDIRAQFHRAIKQEKLLRTGKICLAKTGYHSAKMSCEVINTFVKQYFLLSSSSEIGPSFG